MKAKNMFSVLVALVMLASTLGRTSHAQSSQIQAEQYTDLAIGVPGRTIGTIPGAGGTSLIYGTEGGLQSGGSEWFTQSNIGGGENPSVNDKFGSSIAAGDFDGNGYVDLAIGVPGESILGHLNAGAVHVIYQEPEGWMTADAQLWNETRFGDNQLEAEESFGAALAVGDFNYDGFDDLAIGIPGQDFGIADIGMVRVLFGSFQGLIAEDALFLAQAPFGLGDMIEEEDNFGEELATGDFDSDGYYDLVIGVPQEDISDTVAAGLVHVVPGAPWGFDTAHEWVLWQGEYIQGTPETVDYFGFALATGDFDGNGYDDLAIGVPLENGDETVDEGMIHILWGSWSGLDLEIDQLWWQDLLVPGESENDDAFGIALAAGYFNDDDKEDLAIGASYEDIEDDPDVADAGAVYIMYGDFSGEGYDRFEKEEPEPYEYYGKALAAGKFDGDAWWDLAVGSPLKNGDGGELDVGSIHVMYGDASGLSLSLDQIMDIEYTNGLIPAQNDEFGFALAALTGPVTDGSRIFLPVVVNAP